MTHLSTEILLIAASSYKAFFFFFTPGLFLAQLKEEQMKEVDKYIEKFKDIKYREEAKEMVSSILFEEFSMKTPKNASSAILTEKLKSLKSEIINFYLQSHSKNSTSPDQQDLTYNCDIHTAMGKMLFQLSRLRMVIEPEIQITVNVHKQSQITYLTVKGFWLNDQGGKERKFVRSIGRADEYKKGKDDSRAIAEGSKKIQEVLYEEYLKIYPE